METFCWWLCRTWSNDFLLGLDFDLINYCVYRFLSWFVMSVLCCVLLYDFVHCLLLRRNNKYITLQVKTRILHSGRSLYCHVTFLTLNGQMSRLKIAKIPNSFFCHVSIANAQIYTVWRPKYSSTVPLLHRYILKVERSTVKVEDAKSQKSCFWTKLRRKLSYLFQVKTKMWKFWGRMCLVSRTVDFLVVNY